MSISVKINAKLNLSLQITGISGNYHMLDMVVASAELADVITMRPKKNGIKLSFSNPGIVRETSNAYRAAVMIRERFGLDGMDIFVENNIPCGCGMGSSSADCVGVILAADRLFGLNLTAAQREEIALSLGSDTVYMLTGGYARVSGRGEIVRRFGSSFSPRVIIAYKGCVSAAESYKMYDALNKTYCLDNDALVEAIKNCDRHAVAKGMINVLTEASCTINPAISECLDIVGKTSPCVMTGSGSGVMILPDKQDDTLVERLREHGFCVLLTRILPSKPLPLEKGKT